MNAIKNPKVRKKLVNFKNISLMEEIKEVSKYKKQIFFSKDHVSDYFSVDPEEIGKLILKHRKELENNGMKLVNNRNIKKVFNKSGFSIRYNGYDATAKYYKYEIQIDSAGTFIFTKKTILNISMLLYESSVADRIRNKVIKNNKNIFEKK